MSTILVVEDSETYRTMISELLVGNGFSVDTASNGVEALAKVNDYPAEGLPALIVLDIVMPEMNGYDFCRKVKGDPKMKDVPVVMCSSKSEEFDHYWGMKQGADAYLNKPFEPKELLKTIKHLLNN
ncbi:response regulator transcription factor [Prochlorothrix hollandica]|uniref:Chemotaxis protein CheY n=1 Tax=Prochlorothrix hollandica PCC 9006 = CALU 1027 TaxID=317619 RepID=A0A0M2Q186_PROHO|nr:response regulator [Prochlorothrix hollandica]KKJ01068.1 chemotaxis protein CheY [Prochlorothrix hollandica PCC 9006 = CALU 1027]